MLESSRGSCPMHLTHPLSLHSLDVLKLTRRLECTMSGRHNGHQPLQLALPNALEKLDSPLNVPKESQQRAEVATSLRGQLGLARARHVQEAREEVAVQDAAVGQRLAKMQAAAQRLRQLLVPLPATHQSTKCWPASLDIWSAVQELRKHVLKACISMRDEAEHHQAKMQAGAQRPRQLLVPLPARGLVSFKTRCLRTRRPAAAIASVSTNILDGRPIPRQAVRLQACRK